MRHLLALVFVFLVGAAACVSTAAPPPAPLRVGVAAFGAVDPLATVETLASMRADYVEPALSKLAALPPAELDAARTRIAATGLRAEAMNWFLPGDLPITGPKVDDTRVRAYLERALGIAHSFGTKVIVFGSPQARSFPAGFPPDRARSQLVAFLRTCDDVITAGRFDVVIGIEALRRAETNLVNSVAEALAIAREVDRPHVRLICDFYHLASENEDPAILLQARDWIVHLQIAAPRDRTFPTGFADDARLAPWFEALRTIGYRGRISVEANSKDIAAEAPRAFAFLREATAATSVACRTPSVAAVTEGDRVHVTAAGRPFATVHAGARPRPFVFPLFGPDGITRTRSHPMAKVDGEATDHPHHVSLWFAHGDVSGFDFWQGQKRRERLELDGAPTVQDSDDVVRVRCRYRWLADDDTRVATEERELAFAAHADARTIDVTVTLRPATHALVLGDTKEGSFAVRVRTELCVDGKGASGHLTNSEGARDGAVWGKRARWIDDVGLVDGQQVGIAMFDHPQNHAHPTWWHARTYGLLAANPFGVHDFEKQPAGTGTLTVPVGGSLTLRYRVLLHGAGWDAAKLDTAWRDFAAR